MSLRNVYKNDITTTTTATATYTNTNNIIIITTIVMMTLIQIFVSISTLWNFYSYRCCHIPCLVCTWQLLGCLQKILKCHDIRLPLVYIPFQTWCSFSLGMSLLKVNDILRLSIISVAFPFSVEMPFFQLMMFIQFSRMMTLLFNSVTVIIINSTCA